MPRIVFRQALTGLNGRFAFKVDNDAYYLRGVRAVQVGVFAHLLVAQKVCTFNPVNVALVQNSGPSFIHGLASSDRYQRHAATAPSATQLNDRLTRRTVIVPTDCDCAPARAKLTIYQPLAVERLSYKQRPEIGHRINPTIDCTLESARVLGHRTDTPSEPLSTSDLACSR